jgi:hypothetical protein
VVSRNYFTRQVQTLLKFAKTTSAPKVVTALVDKAAELKSWADKTTPPSDVLCRLTSNAQPDCTVVALGVANDC